MKCDRADLSRILDLRQCYGEQGVKNAVYRFIRGIRGKRAVPVSKRQICEWLWKTPKDAIDDAVAALIYEGKITASPRGLRRPGRNNANLQHVYEVVDESSNA